MNPAIPTATFRETKEGLILSLSFLFFILIAWTAVSLLGLFPSILVPSPWAVGEGFAEVFENGQLWEDFTATGSRGLVGFVLAALVSVPLGLVISRVKALKDFLKPGLSLARFIPVAAYLPLTVLWFGVGDVQKVLVLFIGTLPYLTAMVEEALSAVPGKLVETARTLGASEKEILMKVVLPSAAPAILGALRVSAAIGWSYLILAELIAAQSGLGSLIIHSQRFLQTPLIFVGIVVIGLLGILTDKGFELAQKKLFPWSD